MCVHFRTGLAPHTSISALHAALTRETCALCDSFSSLLFLPTATRCCIHCLKYTLSYTLICLDLLYNLTGVPLSKLRSSAGAVVHLPEKTNDLEDDTTNKEGRVHQFLTEEDAAPALSKGVVKARPVVITDARSPLHGCAATTVLPLVKAATEEAQSGISCKWCQLEFEETAITMDPDFTRRDRSIRGTGSCSTIPSVRQLSAFGCRAREGRLPVRSPSGNVLMGIIRR